MRALMFVAILATTAIWGALPRPAAAGSAQASPSPNPPLPAWQRVRYGNPRALKLRSQVGLVVDEREGVILYAHDMDKPRPIASLTKLLTVMTLLDSSLTPDELIEITRQDRDRLKGSRSSLRYGTTVTRSELMRIALVASDNRAAAALARTYPGGSEALVHAMNDKARMLGLVHTRAVDASGLRPGNVSTGRELARLAYVAREYPSISRWSTTRRFDVVDRKTGRKLRFRNTNSLVHRKRWNIALSKTGFTSEAGNCLLMRTRIAERPLIVVLLNSWGKLSKYGDSGRIRDWLVASERAAVRDTSEAPSGTASSALPLQMTDTGRYAAAQTGAGDDGLAPQH